MASNCVFCNNDFAEYSIKQYDYWDVQLFRDDQYYLGRVVIVLKNRHIEDIFEITMEERTELFENVIPSIKGSLDTVFEPDLYNYTSLGNDCRHVHIHLIPRYKTTRTFNDQRFEDEYWNQTYAKNTDQRTLNNETYHKLISILAKNIPKTPQ